MLISSGSLEGQQERTKKVESTTVGRELLYPVNRLLLHGAVIVILLRIVTVRSPMKGRDGDRTPKAACEYS